MVESNDRNITNKIAAAIPNRPIIFNFSLSVNFTPICSLNYYNYTINTFTPPFYHRHY